MSDQDEPVTAQQVDAIGRKLDDVIVAVDRETDARLAEAEAMRLKYFTARRAMRRSWLAVAVAVVAVAAGLILQWHDQREREDRQVRAAIVTCQGTNAARAALEERIESSGGVFADSLNAVAPIQPGQEEQRAALIQQLKDRYVQRMRDTVPPELGPKDCTERGVTAPTLAERR